MLEDVVKEITRESDGRVFTINFTGGIRAWKSGDASWNLGPIKDNSKAVIKGRVSTVELQELSASLGIRAIAFEDCVTMDGVYHTVVRAILPGRESQVFSAADVWRSIEGNLTRVRLNGFLQTNGNATIDEVNAVLDAKTSIEACSGYIGDSLRSLDISISAICAHYSSQLINAIGEGHDENQRFSNAADMSLYAHVHAFFLQIGAARDYLAKLISIRTGYGESKDSMAKLVDTLKSDRLPSDAMLEFMIDEGYIMAKEAGKRMRQANWLEQVTDLRNQFVHRRPYGSISKENMGRIMIIDKDRGFYKYVRGAVLSDGTEYDLLDIVAYHYMMCNKFFLEISRLSDMNDKIHTITDDDIVSIKLKH